MHPVAFSIPWWHGHTIDIRWYGIAMATSMMVGAWLGARLLRRLGRNGDLVWDALVWIILWSIIGARAVYVATNLHDYASNPWDIFAIWQGGLSFHGGVIAGGIVTYYYFQVARGIPFIEVADCFAPGVSIGIILVRLGNLMNGDILGYKWNGPWAMNFPHDAFHSSLNPGEIILRHPTEIYGLLVGVFCLLASSILWLETYHTKRYAGGAAFMGLILVYSLMRSLIEDPFREVDLPWKVLDPNKTGFGAFTTSHLVAFILIIIAIIGFTQLRRWEKLRHEYSASLKGEAGLSRQQRRAKEREDTKRRPAKAASPAAKPAAGPEKSGADKPAGSTATGSAESPPGDKPAGDANA